ncbi:MAG TPA: COX15/CtaA family protein [Candidatus Binatia bacterium]|nr:COX15/CtaA family protein [Candidatus Binatia bacterium]
MEVNGFRMDAAVDPSSMSFSPWPHRIAVVLACATFPLLFIGGLVTSKGAGLAVPDWPTSFGYNMFLYPWSKMVGNIFYEHSHRLVASFVGLLTIALALIFWLRERRAWLRWLGFAALALVLAQGIIGGLRVVLLQHVLAIIHGATAHAFFALTVCLAIFTSARWARNPVEETVNDGGRLRRLCIVTTALIYLQIVFGALLRHTGERIDAHLALAVLVALHAILILMRVSKYFARSTSLMRPALILFALLLLQLALGGVSYLAKFTTALQLSIDAIVLLTTSHLAVGALMLAASVTLTLRSYRLSVPLKVVRTREVFKEQVSA